MSCFERDHRGGEFGTPDLLSASGCPRPRTGHKAPFPASLREDACRAFSGTRKVVTE
jgi:hypothetical protein